MTYPRIILTIYQNGKKRTSYASITKWRRIYSRLASDKTKSDKYIIRVVYGKFLNNFNKEVIFDNEAESENKNDIMKALSLFLKI